MIHRKASYSRSRDPTDVYYKRILEMMRDYKLTMQDAIIWDMDGFMPYPSRGMIMTEEEEVDFYLHINYIPADSRVFFQGVALGAYDYTLEVEEDEAEQKDAGSPSET
jgi:hypothetical protein